MAVSSPVEPVLLLEGQEMYQVTSGTRTGLAPGTVWGHSLHEAALVSGDVTASSPSTVDWVEIDLLNID